MFDGEYMVSRFCLKDVQAFAVIVAVAAMVSGCQVNPRADSPDVKYSKRSSKAVALQVPPDLTDVSRGEQFILPGDVGSAVTRNTLLPNFDSVRFVRQGSQSWLESGTAAEALWPRLLAFLNDEGYDVERTVPAQGLIETQWRDASDAGTLKSLVGNSQRQRMGFRLERLGAGGTRLFGRLQRSNSASAEPLSWSADASSPELTAPLMQRLLVYLGIDEQRAKGLLGDDAAAAVLAPASLQTTTAGATLLVHYGYRPGFAAIESASTALGMAIGESDVATGVLTVTDAGGSIAEKDSVYTLQLRPLHVSAVSVSVADSGGKKLDNATERKLLIAIRDTLT